ncbi:MAG TPA: DUF1292 domain-containing protein [Candidatus Avidehalobacter gallistercoris]|uniref:UPF0473 protein IAB00_03445 n=1 Tax=Candidatus Avidehalobacter gallistercoris TaxID=2840694 RepID=A0A9D1KYG8_9FIRM|nr:DUF1292 domain-containing protein [Candidatus Avidehalobacter gallistercoris]
MTQNEIENENIITLLDDDDNPIDFEIIEVLEIQGKRYAFLLPLNDEEDTSEEDEAVIFRIDPGEDGEEIFAYIEDDDEWEMVVDTYNDLLFDEE